MTADLHVHTCASDGLLSPREVLSEAQAAGLTHIAITDHDTVDGLATLQDWQPSPGQPVLIPGIEFSTDLDRHEVHILGYHIDIRHPELNRQIRLITDDRLTRAERMVHKLCQLGYPMSYRRVLEIAGDSSAVGRPHVAAGLLEKGYFESIDQVFDTLLEKNKPAYVPHYQLTRQDTIRLILDAGGIPVLAHPGLVGDVSVVLETIAMGIQGVEVYHPKHTDEQVTLYEQLAAAHGLLTTGGSDFHGMPGRFPERLGQFTVPARLALSLVAPHA